MIRFDIVMKSCTAYSLKQTHYIQSCLCTLNIYISCFVHCDWSALARRVYSVGQRNIRQCRDNSNSGEHNMDSRSCYF